MGHKVIVDGYNIIKNNDMYRSVETVKLEHARALLIQHLHQRFRTTAATVIVVFDGNDDSEHVRHEQHIRVIFSRHGERADDVIARLATEAHQAGHSVEMYSSDVEVQERVVQQGGSVHATTQLGRQLNRAPRDVMQRFQDRQKAKRDYGLDPMHKAVDEEEFGGQRPGKRRKRASRRR